jgi:glycosyltransferase involved in cell wall biosynthesis
VDNCSTDGSGDIAASFAARDSRVRLVRRSSLLSQVQNYNAAVLEISSASQFCKIVQADDYIFPDCLRLMLEAFAQSEAIGLVSSYYLKGDSLRGSGFPHPTTWMPGREMARFYLRSGVFVFGSPSTVMYRSSLVRDHSPFFDESLLHEDTEKCLQLLEHCDFGFVHQVLSFLRLGNESISSTVRDFQPDALDWYIIAQRYAPIFLETHEAEALQLESRREYYAVLAREALRFPGPGFWEYHQRGLKSLGETIDHPYLALRVFWRFLTLVANPGTAIARLIGSRARTRQRQLQSAVSDTAKPQ